MPGYRSLVTLLHDEFGDDLQTVVSYDEDDFEVLYESGPARRFVEEAPVPPSSGRAGTTFRSDDRETRWRGPLEALTPAARDSMRARPRRSPRASERRTLAPAA